MDIYKIFTVEAARSLPNLPDDHRCNNIHVHSFKIIITVSGICIVSPAKAISAIVARLVNKPTNTIISIEYRENCCQLARLALSADVFILHPFKKI